MSAIHFLKLGRDSIPHNKWICAQVIYVKHVHLLKEGPLGILNLL